MLPSAGGHSDLLDAGQLAFGFLVERGATVERHEGPLSSGLAYVLPTVTFEVEYDWTEQAAFLLVAKTIEGHRPPGYYMHEGREVRIHLAEALRRVGALDPTSFEALRAAQRHSGPAAMATQVEVFARTLSDGLPVLQQRWGQVFSVRDTGS